MTENENDSSFVDLNLSDHDDTDLTRRFSSTHLDRPASHDMQTPPPSDSGNPGASIKDSDTQLVADRLLNDLSEEDATSKNAATFPMNPPQSAPYTSPPSANPNTSQPPPHSQYDQFFEEVSLDLPRDTEQSRERSNSSKLLKFMPRRTPAMPSSDLSLSINTTDAGPFYSISDVLDDSPSTGSKAAGAAAAAAAAAMAAAASGRDTDGAADQKANQRGARRNIHEQEVIVTSGGSSVKGIQRRSSLNPFTRTKATHHKPTPLESVISKTRPRMLPPKNPQEEKKHLQQHEAMMKKALQLEAKREKEYHRRKEQKDKKLSQATQIWERDILPHWNTKSKDKKTRELWLQGIPPRCRKRVWLIAIDNPLKLSKDVFQQCLRRVPQIPRTTHADDKKYEYESSTNIMSNKRANASYEHQTLNNNSGHSGMERSYSSDDIQEMEGHTDESFYNFRRTRRTSSLNVLHEDEDKKSGSGGLEVPPSPRSSSESTTVTYELHRPEENYASQDDQNVDKTDMGFGGRAAMELLSEESLDQYRNSFDDSVQVEDDYVLDDEDENGTEDNDNLEALGSHPDATSADMTTIAFLNKMIDEDILRTLPSLCVFQPDGPLFSSVRKVLHAYVGYQPTLTYTRGTSFLAGMLLLNMGTQDTFQALVNLIHRSDILWSFYHADEARVKSYFKIFNVVFAENLPKLYLHFKNLALTPDNYLPDWFMTIFSSVIPLELSSRLWDIFLLEGDIVLIRTGLVVLKYLEPLLWGGGFGETVKILNMGFVGEHRGEEVRAALAVSGHITQGEQDQFFDEIIGKDGIHLDDIKYRELYEAHFIPR
ncbi:rab-GTPase-TBC domain-containing protein [Radiomyces spectabilis]|uniref:rab-GTPase-TBC domain-containing protein n=1 Tax=Radiomyces spectabilis TaxID=64574 RepID=UPI00221FFD74|nr:rab-GTPase-TBC domain-containing protein [Radiomyces spectabilis]KAI8393510.1 rab-GTPase-TBC domain-containing protein [Radiomyces spectabilis]